MENFMSSNFNINNIVYACKVSAGQGTNIQHINRPSHGLALFLGGKRIFHFDKKKLTVENASIVYFPKGSTYTITNIKATDCYAINFQIDEPVNFEPFSIKIKDIQHYIQNFKTSKNLWNTQSTSYQMKIKSELYDIIYKLHNEYAQHITKKQQISIQPAVDYIGNHFLKENISVSTLAQLCGFSEVYLRKLFLKEFGSSPNKYIKQRKLQHAKDLLLSGFYKVNEVCYLSGFNDESYFNREFKKYFHQPPKEYAKNYRNEK